MQELKFSYNWNGKLDADFFTAIILSPRFTLDEIILIKKESRKTDTGKVIIKIKTQLEKLTELVCRIETGYSRTITIELIKKMYPNITDWKEQPIYLYGIQVRYEGKTQETYEEFLHNEIVEKPRQIRIDKIQRALGI